jgi:hypothetical protein
MSTISQKVRLLISAFEEEYRIAAMENYEITRAKYDIDESFILAQELRIPSVVMILHCPIIYGG